MNLRQMMIKHLNRINNRITDYGTFPDIELFEHFVKVLECNAYNKGYDQCCKDDPDVDNITYLV